MKRLIRENVNLDGSLDNAKFSRVILQYQNTRDRDTGKLPVEFLMGHQLSDFLPKPKEQLVGKPWSHLAAQRESVLALRGAKLKERLSQRTKALVDLNMGNYVAIQNQTGNYPLRWEKTGVIIEAKGYDQYKVMTHGLRRVMLRNRKFLRKIEKPALRFTNPGTTTSFQPRQSLGEDQEKQEEAPRAGTHRSAGPGPQTKVINQSNIQPSLTDDEHLHVNH